MHRRNFLAAIAGVFSGKAAASVAPTPTVPPARILTYQPSMHGDAAYISRVEQMLRCRIRDPAVWCVAPFPVVYQALPAGEPQPEDYMLTFRVSLGS